MDTPDYKVILTQRGYAEVLTNDAGTAFVNEGAKYCAMLIHRYVGDEDEVMWWLRSMIGDLHQALRRKYNFADKATVALIVSSDAPMDHLSRDVYHYLKAPAGEAMHMPSKRTDHCGVTFEPAFSKADYPYTYSNHFYVDPYRVFDGAELWRFIKFLSAQEGNSCTVHYPAIYEPAALRYHAGKLFKVHN